MTVTGRVALSLIATTTRTMSLSPTSLQKIGNLLVLLATSIVPNSPNPQCFQVTDSNEQLYVNEFCRQLHIPKENMTEIGFHALSILVNRDLNPHYDSMNPVDQHQDYTLSVSVQIPTHTLPDSIQKKAYDMYGLSIPLCIVLYKRKSLIHLCNRIRKLDAFIHSDDHKVNGRQKLRDLLHSVNTDADFSGRFFEKTQWKSQQQQFVNVSDIGLASLGITKLYVSNEAVDKMAYWSPLLHVFYLYAQNTTCLSATNIISFALFFSHQCSGTLMFVQAMMRLIIKKDNDDSQMTLYGCLVRECLELKGKPNEHNSKDVGMSPKYPRHGPSGQKPYTETEATAYCAKMNNLLHAYGHKMSKLKADSDKYHLTSALLLDIMNDKNIVTRLPGHGPLRTMHFIHLCALIGVIPLEFYVYTPLHYGGGVKNYLHDGYRYQQKSSQQVINNELTDWSISENTLLEEHYTTEFTGNMHENAACMIGRRTVRNDVLYYLPWGRKLNEENLLQSRCQLMFRINGYRRKAWTLESYNGGERIQKLHNFDMVENGSSIIAYNRNSIRLCNHGHVLNNTLLGTFVYLIFCHLLQNLLGQKNAKDCWYVPLRSIAQ